METETLHLRQFSTLRVSDIHGIESIWIGYGMRFAHQRRNNLDLRELQAWTMRSVPFSKLS